MAKKKTTKKKVKGRTPRPKRKIIAIDIKTFDMDKFLFIDRQIFLTGGINQTLSTNITKQLITLSRLDKESPILIWINSVGGSFTDGLAIIDAIQNSPSPTITIISGGASSMAGIISVCATKRYITPNSYWMGHEGTIEASDYLEKAEDRIEHCKVLMKQVHNILRNKTKLTDRDLRKATTGELWLGAEECLNKGIVDGIFK